MVVGDSRIFFSFFISIKLYLNWLHFYSPYLSFSLAAVTWHFGPAYFSTGPVGISYWSLTGTGGLERPQPCTSASPVTPPVAPLSILFQTCRRSRFPMTQSSVPSGTSVWRPTDGSAATPRAEWRFGATREIPAAAAVVVEGSRSSRWVLEDGDEGYIWCGWTFDTC